MKQLDSVPQTKKLTLACMILVLVIGLFYVVWWEPTRIQIEMVQQEIQQLDQEIQRNTNTTKELMELQAGVEKLEKKLLKKRGPILLSRRSKNGFRAARDEIG